MMRALEEFNRLRIDQGREKRQHRHRRQHRLGHRRRHRLVAHAAVHGHRRRGEHRGAPVQPGQARRDHHLRDHPGATPARTSSSEPRKPCSCAASAQALPIYAVQGIRDTAAQPQAPQRRLADLST
jgi:hypothetical protein